MAPEVLDQTIAIIIRQHALGAWLRGPSPSPRALSGGHTAAAAGGGWSGEAGAEVEDDESDELAQW